MAEGKTAIWTPNGVVTLGGKKAERVELTPGLMEWFYQFDAFARKFGLGLHCSHCGNDVIGKNAENAKVFSATCGCREFIGKNRDYRPQEFPPVVM